MQNNIIFRFLLTNIFISKIFELHLHHYSLFIIKSGGNALNSAN